MQYTFKEWLYLNLMDIFYKLSKYFYRLFNKEIYKNRFKINPKRRG
jgi:hypothetical protein